MEHVLAILDEEVEYVSRLLRYFNSREGKGFDAAAFTNEESFKQYGLKHSIGLLVCEESLYAAMAEVPECPTLLLSAKRQLKEGDGPPVLCKYQSAQEIFEAITAYYHEMMPDSTCKGEGQGAKILAVCSAMGGNGVSTLAYMLAKKKAKTKKVAFLSLDPFFMPEKAEKDMSGALSEAIYFIRQDSAKFSGKLKFKMVERMDCLYGVAHWSDLCECSRQEAVKLLRGIEKAGQYELIVVDSGAFTALSAGCIGVSDTIVFLTGEGKRAQAREEEFLRQAKCMDAGISERLICISRQPVERAVEEVLVKIG